MKKEYFWHQQPARLITLAGQTLPYEQISEPRQKSERRHADFFDVVSSLLKINTPQQFCAWTQNELQWVFPHGVLACGIGQVKRNGVDIKHVLTCNLPKEHFHVLHQPRGLAASPILARWARTKRPVLFEMGANSNTSPWLESFLQFQLDNLAAHGLCDSSSRNASYFSFSKIPGNLTERHAALLELLVPHMHIALTRALSTTEKNLRKPKLEQSCITSRQKEILQWMVTGKTNWEIAQVLHISEHTIKNHVQHILIRLKVNTRAQAVAKAINLKIINSEMINSNSIGRMVAKNKLS